MKKLILTGFLFSTLVYANSLFVTQEQLKEQLIPSFKNSIIFEKFKPILAREGKIGETIQTFTKDGLETVNQVVTPSYIVKNTTDAKEEYIVTKDKFEKRYTFLKKENKTWSTYKPIGEIKVIKVKNDHEFFILAPWGEKMIVKKGDFLVSPLDYSEIYRIANKEFFETYKPKNTF